MKEPHGNHDPALSRSTVAREPRLVNSDPDSSDSLPSAALNASDESAARAARNQKLLTESQPGQARRVLWIDGVGGYLLLDKDEILIGQALSGSSADLRIVGDLSRQAAAIRRSEGDYLIQPLQPTRINGLPIDRPQILSDGCEIQLGERVRLAFAQPSPLSHTARLKLVSLNKFRPTVDGVLLLSDSCVLGPSPGSHIHCPTWKTEILMFRHNDGWYFRTLEKVEVDGMSTEGQIPLVSGMRMKGEDFSLSVE